MGMVKKAVVERVEQSLQAMKEESKDNRPKKSKKRQLGEAAVEETAAVEPQEAPQEATRAPKKKKNEKAVAEQKAAEEASVEETPEEQQKKKNKKAKKEAKTSETTAAAPDATAAAPVAEVDDIDPEEFRKKMQISSNSGPALPEPVQRLDAAPFPKKIRNALQAAGFTAPTAIQAQGWPVATAGTDLVAVAKTGSGKTLGFLLPAFRKLIKEQTDCSAGPAVLVLSPTRELCVQIEDAAVKFGACAGITSTAVYGGVPKGPQVKALKAAPQVLVATPGRLVDLMNDKAAVLGSVCYLVLDEADRMLDMGFEPQMEQIMKQISTERQTLLFSATWPKAVQKLARNYLKADATHVNVGETEELSANKAVSQQFFKLDDDEKEAKLWGIIDGLPEDAKIIVFANTKRRIDKLQKEVWNFNWECVAMHGDKSQWERDAGLADFVSGKKPLMFATDVCARGLDIKNVTHVVNFDMARDVESYIHRIGRTGRAGMTGISITFFNEAYDMECAPALAKIAREAGQEVPTFLEKAAAKGGGKGKNKLWKY